MNFSAQEIKKYEETYALIQAELKKHNIPFSDLKNVVKIISDFEKEYGKLEENNKSIYFIFLLVVTYKAGRESVVI